MKKVQVFISYRNIIHNGTYENYKLLLDLKTELEKQNFLCKFLKPEEIPPGTLFSPYDIADFLYKTFLMVDDCDKFIILDKDYFDENGQMTSIWTEAEYCIWSYYSRTGFLNKYKSKDTFYTLAQPSEAGFIFSQIPLYTLSDAQRTLLRVCSLDFDKAPLRPNYSLPYKKTQKYLITVCSNCQKAYIVNTKELKKLRSAQAVCSCGNEFQFGIDRGHYVCSQMLQSAETKKINIFEALQLLFEKKPVYEILELYGRKV